MLYNADCLVDMQIVRFRCECSSIFQLPASGDVYSYYVDMESRRFEPWEKIIPAFKYDAEVLLIYSN